MHRADNLASLSLSDIRRKYAVFLAESAIVVKAG
jgi:hypothetical protein